MKRFLLPAFALALAVNANATSFQANMAAEQQAEAKAAQETVTYKGKLNIEVYGGHLDPTDATIVVSKESNGTYTFVLKDFSVTVAGQTLNIGDATISNLEPKESNGVITLECTDKDAPVTNGGMDGILKDNKVIITMKSTIDNYVLTTDISQLTVRLIDEEEDLGYSEIPVKADFKSESYTLPTATAPQLNDFSGDWETCIPWDSKGNTESSGTQPKGWHISNVQTALGAVVAGAKAEGSNGTTVAVKLTNQEKAGQMIPAYMSLGTPWATAETKLINVRNADGGTFGGLEFTYRPDAISFDYQRNNSNGKENATAIAYLWKGTWTQTNVPGNTAVSLNPLEYGTATKCTMVNRDRNILGNETSATLGDPAKPSEDAKLIAKLEQPISESTKGTWKSMTIPFTYNDDTAVPEHINVIFAANDYFGDRKSIIKGNSLTIDNVKLVYYHALNSLTYNGTPVANFDEGTTEYTLNGKLAEDFDKVEFTVKGVGASYDVAKDEANNVATITVKGNDYDVNPSSKTVYTIKFDGTVGINGITTSTNTANGAIYDLSGRQLKTMQKGINIVRGKDGKMIKVMK
ncbi:calycin-like domain-containing protein [Prevotella stercorea]|uniref:calycin-like domain-containing protein n=1 Tax=Leyella stercorea TaxID=363265 RepID=UPI001F2DF8B2|nr:calycin-like domain-containing protein [Leyella stercorea]MCF2577857.1 calycin-like domain-containing protein [Leyella stercorea]